MEGLGATFATSPLGLESHLNGLLGQGYERSLIFESCSGDLEVPLHLNSPVLGVVRKAVTAHLLVLWSSGIVDSEVQGVSHDHRELSRVGGQADSAKEAAAGKTSNCRTLLHDVFDVLGRAGTHGAWRLTFDTSGGPKGAKRPSARPPGGGVRRHSDQGFGVSLSHPVGQRWLREGQRES